MGEPDRALRQKLPEAMAQGADLVPTGDRHQIGAVRDQAVAFDGGVEA